MNFAETHIYYDSEPVFESEDAPQYGEFVTTVALSNAWVSPNYLYGKHWRKSQQMREELLHQVRNHVLRMAPEERKGVVLTEPAPRVMRVTITKGRGPYPDVDNLMGGLKHAIDALRRVKYRQRKTEGKRTVVQTNDGPGLIWDDAPKYLRIAELYVCRRSQTKIKDPLPGNFVLFEIFEWPSSAAHASDAEV
jgi:hypothetical protein